MSLQPSQNSLGFKSYFLRRLVNGSKWENPEIEIFSPFKDPFNYGGSLKAEILSSGGISEK